MVRVLLSAMTCVLCVLQKCLDFICDQAFIVTAMQGTNMCSSFREAWRLLLREIKLTLTVTYMANLVLGFGKWVIVLTSTLLMFAILETPKGSTMALALGSVKTNADQVTSPVLPLLGCMLFSYAVASAFMNVYYMAIQTILLSFTKDIELNGPDSGHYKSPGAYAMGETLRGFMNTDAKEYAFMGLNHKRGKGDTYTTIDKTYEDRVV